MLVHDNSFVAWHGMRELCPVKTLSAVVLQREQLPVWFKMLVSMTAQELMSMLFARARVYVSVKII
jgi:hypothetical protein